MATISGNCGAANVWVRYYGALVTSPQIGFVLSDGSGNYVTPALANDTYVIRPLSAVYTFGPANSTQVMSGTNITGVNFTAAALANPFTFTQIGVDTFTRADESPLNATNWRVPTAGLYAGIGLQIVSNACETTNALGGMETWIGSSLPADQYSECTIGALDVGAFSTILVRNNNLTGFGPAIELDFGGPIGPTAYFNLIQITDDGLSVQYDWYNATANCTIDIETGDVFRLAISGQASGYWYIYKNGLLVDVGALGASGEIIPNGYSGMQMQTTGLFSGMTFTHYANGQFSGPGAVLISVDDYQAMNFFPWANRPVTVFS
jgi:hypothetical protein